MSPVLREVDERIGALNQAEDVPADWSVRLNESARCESWWHRNSSPHTRVRRRPPHAGEWDPVSRTGCHALPCETRLDAVRARGARAAL